jgi:membrane AbrB-like protein
LEQVLYFLVTVAVGTAGGLLAKKAKMPAGGMVGAMIATIIFNVWLEKGVFPAQLRTVIQIFTGAMIGSKMRRQDVAAIRHLALPMVIVLISVFSMNLLCAWGMYRASTLDLATCLFATAPGGMSDMPLIGAELGGNPGYIAILQLVRILPIFVLMPPIFKKLVAWDAKKHPAPVCEAQAFSRAGTSPAKPVLDEKTKTLRFLLTVAASAAGGLLFKALGVPAGAMIGSMLFSILFSVSTDRAYYPGGMRIITQIASGIYIGLRMDRAGLMNLTQLAVPALLVALAVCAFTALCALVLYKCTKLPLATCLMVSTPGGVQEMALLADDLGADVPTIAVMQSVRLMTVVAVAPTALAALLSAMA